MAQTADLDFIEATQQYVKVLRPMPSVFPRGPASEKRQSPTFSIRVEQHEMEAVEKAAALLGVTRGYFTRWSAHQMAKEVLKQHQEYMRNKR